MILAWGQWERQVALHVWWGFLWVWKVNCTQKVCQLWRGIWVASPTLDPAWSSDMLYVISSASFSYLASPYHSPGPNHKHPPPGVVSSGFEPTAPPTTPSPSPTLFLCWKCACRGGKLRPKLMEKLYL